MQSTALRPSIQSHVHLSGQQCPFCEQDIPFEKLEETRGRIAAREQEWLNEATARLREQHARERSQADAKAKSDLEEARHQGAAAIEALKAETAAREASIRAEAVRTAEEAAQTRINEINRVRLQETSGLQAKLQAVEEGKVQAEQRSSELSSQLDVVRAEKDAALKKAAEDASTREQAIRIEAAQTADANYRERLQVAEQAKEVAETARQTVEAELRAKLTEAGQELQGLKEVHAAEINQQRDALEKDKTAAVNAERVMSLETKMKLETQLQDMQRQLQKRTADEHGEGAELELFEILKAAFEDDKVRRVQKGTPGADIVHEVMLNGKLCGKIVYDSKNRNKWATEYATKLRQDQIAEKADHAILSSNKFPSGERQLHILDHVIIACPARVLVLAQLLRAQIVQMHDLRISNEARDDKMAELYDFITSERCGQLLDSVETLVRKLEKIEVDEEKAHRAVWTKRGELLRAVLKANGDLCFALNRITGTAAAVETQ